MSHQWYDDPGDDAAVRRAHHRRLLYAEAHYAATERLRRRHLEEFTRLLREECLRVGYLPPLPQLRHTGEPVPPDTIEPDAPDPTEPPPPEPDRCRHCNTTLDELRPYPRYCSDRCLINAALAEEDDEPATTG